MYSTKTVFTPQTNKCLNIGNIKNFRLAVKTYPITAEMVFHRKVRDIFGIFLVVFGHYQFLISLRIESQYRCDWLSSTLNEQN